MTFKDWLQQSGMSMHALGKLCGLPTSTILNLKLGRPVLFRTIKKLVRVTRKFPKRVTYEMFPRVFMRGKNTMVSGPQAYKDALRKALGIRKE